MSERILLIRTGGTIDAIPYTDPQQPPEIVDTLKSSESLIMQTVRELPDHQRVDEYIWGAWQENQFIKDSKLFTDDDMNALADIIKNDNHRMFVITHGTDAMVKNATMLQERLVGSNKIVAFVGAMIPLSMRKEHESDGVNSLGFSINNIANQKPGVYVVGHDTHSKRLGFFDPSLVEKDRKASAVERLFTLKNSSGR